MRTPFLLYKVVEESINLILYFFIYTSMIQRSKHIKKSARATRKAPHMSGGAQNEKLTRYFLEGWGIAGRKRRGVFGYKDFFLG